MTLGTVVFVNGVLASTLHVRLGFLGDVEVWLNPPVLVAGGLKRLKLPPAGEGGVIPPTPSIIEGGPLTVFYGYFLDWLRQQGWRVVSATQDWRRPQSHDAATLTTLLTSIAEEEDVWIVAHSRGGLLTRRALASLASAGLLGRVKRVVGLGVPHGGSFDAVKALATYSPYQQSIFNMSLALFGVLGTVLTYADIRDVMQTWPSIYELMPSPNHGWIPSAEASKLYLPQTWEDVALPVVSQYLTDASAAWASLPPIPSGVEWIDVAGTGFPTADRLPPWEDIAKPGVIPTHLSGDGLVTVSSATASGRRKIITPTAHAWFAQDGRLWERIHSALLSGLTADVELEGSPLGY